MVAPVPKIMDNPSRPIFLCWFSDTIKCKVHPDFTNVKIWKLWFLEMKKYSNICLKKSTTEWIFEQIYKISLLWNTGFNKVPRISVLFLSTVIKSEVKVSYFKT
jgi:hypothetical protein